MAKSKIPDPLERRHLLERELPPAQALRLAEAYLAEGRTLEAVDFLRKAEAKDRLAALRAEAVAAGDSFLLRMLRDRARGDGRPGELASARRGGHRGGQATTGGRCAASGRSRGGVK